MRLPGIGTAFVLLLAAIPCAAKVVVEGAPVEAEVHADGRFVRYAPVFAALGITHAYDPALRRLRVLRPYDNARFELALPDGILRANGHVIGTLPGAADERPEEGWLTPNAIAILSGSHAKAIEGGWSFELDERLRPDANLELWVNGARVVTVQAPRAFGTTLLVPLRPVVDALGSRVAVDGPVVTVTRVQDGAVVSWHSQSGMVTANRRPVGLVAPSALMDLASLLLPRDAVAALTGTHVSILPGTNRVEAVLDDRLAGRVTPSASVLDRARASPFTVERLMFQAGTLGTNFVDVRAHRGLLNGRLLVEAPADGAWLGRLDQGGAAEVDPWRPSWVALEWQSLEGMSGIVGDAIASRRELEGSDVSRWRGLTVQAPAAGGSYRIVAGSPLTASGDAKAGSVPRFDGEVAGIRWYGAGKAWEAGLVALHGAGSGRRDRAVANVTHYGDLKLDGMTVSTYTDVSFGRFRGNDEDRWGGRLTHSTAGSTRDGWNFGGGARYAGSAFAATGAPCATCLVPVEPGDRGAVDAYVNRTIRENLTGGLRAFGTRTGIEEPLASRSIGLGGQLSWALPGQGTTITADYSHVDSDSATGALAGSLRVDRLSLSLDRRMDPGHLLSARAEDTDSRGAIRQRLRSLAVSLGLAPIQWAGPRGQTAALTPYAGASWSWSRADAGRSKSAALNGTLNVTYDSGTALGDRWRVTASGGYSAGRTRSDAQAQYLDALLGGVPVETGAVSTSSNGAYFDLRSRHRLSRSLWFEWGVNKLQGSDATLFLVLQGAFDTAPRRATALPMPSRGQVQGVVYLDGNDNGRRDEGEQGVAHVVVRLPGTPWAVRTDAGGHFTVNNLPQGAYSLQVDPLSLSLGMRGAGQQATHVSVLDQQLTEVALPLVRAGQIRGRVFTDLDGNGIADRDEDGPVGMAVSLVSAKGTTVVSTAAFGQFVFDGLPFGTYRVIVEGREREAAVTAEQPFVVVDVPAPPAAEGRTNGKRNGKRRTARSAP